MYHGYFVQALDTAFRYFDKKMFYAWLYNNAKAKQMYRDFGNMYLMGGEL